MKNENIESGMRRVTTRDAAKELNMDVETLQYLMRKERLPIGMAVKREKAKRTTYIIWRGALDAYKRQLTE